MPDPSISSQDAEDMAKRERWERQDRERKVAASQRAVDVFNQAVADCADADRQINRMGEGHELWAVANYLRALCGLALEDFAQRHGITPSAPEGT